MEQVPSNAKNIPPLIRAKHKKQMTDAKNVRDALTFSSQTRSGAHCVPAQNRWSDAEKISTLLEISLRREMWPMLVDTDGNAATSDKLLRDGASWSPFSVNTVIVALSK